MDHITVKRTTMVKPAEPTPTPRRSPLWLSEVDLLNNNMHTPTVYFYRPPPSPPSAAAGFFDPRVLERALARALVPFYPLAGRFGLGGDGRLEIECNGEGVLFVEAESSAAVDDFGDFAPAAELRSLVPAVDYTGGVASYPLFVSQVTYFRCGGVALGIGSEHRVVDGPSNFHFVNTWSDFACGLGLKIPPYLDRTILRPRDPPRPIFNHIEYQITKPNKTQNPKLSSKIALFKLTREQLNTLKTKAKEGNNKAIKHSTFEVVAGHIWKCTLIARGVSSDEETRLYFSTNGRFSRLKPPLPIGYFGNVVFTSVSIARSGDIKSKPFCYAASQIRETLARMDNDYLRSAIDYLKLNRGTSRYMDHNFRTPNISVTSWIGMPLYDADFGWGPPFYMGSGGVSYSEGKATVWPTAAQDGSLYVVISLQHEHMKLFEKLFYVFDENEIKCKRDSTRASL